MMSKLAMLAKKTIEAAWLNGPSYDLATQAAEALESAQLLQSPETAAFAAVQALREDQAVEDRDGPALVIYRAAWDVAPLGWYTTEDEARKHCEDHARRDIPGATLDWMVDEEDGVAELAASFGEDERSTGYVVTALEVASKYDPEADE